MADTLSKAVDFTTGSSPQGGEVRALEVWLVLVLEAVGVLPLERAQAIVREIGRNPIATLPGRNIAAGLLAEHFRSLLPNDLEDAAAYERAILEQLRGDFERTVEEFLARRRPASPEPPERPEIDR